MLLTPYFLLQRRRLLAAGVTALVLPVLVLFFITGTFRVFSHTACRCTPEPDDLRVLLKFFSLSCVLLSLVLGFAGSSGTGLSNQLKFHLTRPASRAATLILPFALDTLFVAALPMLGACALLLGLSATHATVLSLLRADLGFLTGVSTLNSHSGFVEVAAAAQLGRRYFAGMLLGMDASALFVSARWLMQSPRLAIKLTGIFSGTASYPLSWALPRSFLFLSPRYAPPTWPAPSDFNLTLHLFFAVAWLLFTYRVLMTIEL